MHNPGERTLATLWRLAWEGNHLTCVVYNTHDGMQLSIESPEAVVIREKFDLQPRALARARALREALKRRGWHDTEEEEDS
jgi:hypothetical protein